MELALLLGAAAFVWFFVLPHGAPSAYDAAATNVIGTAPTYPGGTVIDAGIATVLAAAAPHMATPAAPAPTSAWKPGKSDWMGVPVNSSPPATQAPLFRGAAPSTLVRPIAVLPTTALKPQAGVAGLLTRS